MSREDRIWEFYLNKKDNSYATMAKKFRLSRNRIKQIVDEKFKEKVNRVHAL